MENMNLKCTPVQVRTKKNGIVTSRSLRFLCVFRCENYVKWELFNDNGLFNLISKTNGKHTASSSSQSHTINENCIKNHSKYNKEKLTKISLDKIVIYLKFNDENHVRTSWTQQLKRSSKMNIMIRCVDLFDRLFDMKHARTESSHSTKCVDLSKFV